jgi:hypothetical protein
MGCYKRYYCRYCFRNCEESYGIVNIKDKHFAPYSGAFFMFTYTFIRRNGYYLGTKVINSPQKSPKVINYQYPKIKQYQGIYRFTERYKKAFFALVMRRSWVQVPSLAPVIPSLSGFGIFYSIGKYRHPTDTWCYY